MATAEVAAAIVEVAAVSIKAATIAEAVAAVSIGVAVADIEAVIVVASIVAAIASTGVVIAISTGAVAVGTEAIVAITTLAATAIALVTAIVDPDVCSLATVGRLALQLESKSKLFVSQHLYPSFQGQPIQLPATMETSDLTWRLRLTVDLVERVVQLFGKSVEHPRLLDRPCRQTFRPVLLKVQLHMPLYQRLRLHCLPWLHQHRSCFQSFQ